MTIQRKPVRSSNIRSVGHDPKTQTMHVEFHDGRVYEYPETTTAEHRALVSAPSVGKHFHAIFRSREARQIA